MNHQKFKQERIGSNKILSLMTLRTRRKRILILSFLCTFLFNACGSIVSLKKYTEYWVGRSIDEKIENSPSSYQDKNKYQLDNGNWVYVETDKPGCFIHWEVNPQGVISDYRLKGSCH